LRPGRQVQDGKGVIMNRVMIPNSFQVPNFLVDKLLPEFTGAETKVAIFIMAKAAENMTNVVNLSSKVCNSILKKGVDKCQS
jgi:hypothetical protein